jgi:hypothetical protein
VAVSTISVGAVKEVGTIVNSVLVMREIDGLEGGSFGIIVVVVTVATPVWLGSAYVVVVVVVTVSVSRTVGGKLMSKAPAQSFPPSI